MKRDIEENRKQAIEIIENFFRVSTDYPYLSDAMFRSEYNKSLDFISFLLFILSKNEENRKLWHKFSDRYKSHLLLSEKEKNHKDFLLCWDKLEEDLKKNRLLIK